MERAEDYLVADDPALISDEFSWATEAMCAVAMHGCTADASMLLYNVCAEAQADRNSDSGVI